MGWPPSYWARAGAAGGSRAWGGGGGAGARLPAARLGGQVSHQGAPGRGGQGRAAAAVQADPALVGIEIGDGAQQQSLARARGPEQGERFAGGEIEIHGREPGTTKGANLKHDYASLAVRKESGKSESLGS